MRLAVLGGSFNPVHLGHLYLADAVLSGFGYDRVIFIPAFQSPFKLGAPAPDPRDRLDMLAASIPGDPRLLIDDCEIRREGVSYTVDTLADIIRRYLPEGKPGLILGDDLGRDFPKWKDFEKIVSLADIIIARRILSEAGEYPYPCVQMQNDVMQISSAQVRELISGGKHWRYLVPAGARAIIEDRGLYGAPPVPAAGTASPVLIVRLEEEARRRLSQPRFLHSRQVAVMTSDLCRFFGLDSRAGYLAGICHDMGKQLGEEELFKLAKADKRGISALEKRKPSLLHGRAGAMLLKKEYGIRDQEILDAVAFHTTGSPAMGPLAKALYIADKVESSREGVECRLRDFSEYAGTGEPGLDRLFEKILRETLAWLRVKNIDPSEDALKLLAKLEGRASR
ncbi:MAG: nicotinate (nicotinamide) nucleotide adenylyltransferase [Treponema sp.]|jgi:nicotinate-nucleotide adenylyltransferase|nr:nicotinate (nicotinamide) nucleotide adenylyltransferase [Treponema sp.]